MAVPAPQLELPATQQLQQTQAPAPPARRGSQKPPAPAATAGRAPGSAPPRATQRDKAAKPAAAAAAAEHRHASDDEWEEEEGEGVIGEQQGLLQATQAKQQQQPAALRDPAGVGGASRKPLLQRMQGGPQQLGLGHGQGKAQGRGGGGKKPAGPVKAPAAAAAAKKTEGVMKRQVRCGYSGALHGAVCNAGSCCLPACTVPSVDSPCCTRRLPKRHRSSSSAAAAAAPRPLLPRGAGAAWTPLRAPETAPCRSPQPSSPPTLIPAGSRRPRPQPWLER